MRRSVKPGVIVMRNQQVLLYHAPPSFYSQIARLALEEKGVEYRTAKFPFRANGKALALGETDGLVKVIADNDNKLIGVHIFGPHASDVLHEGIVAVTKGMTTEDIKSTMHAHPTLPEAFFEAVLSLDGIAIHQLNK